MAMRYHVVGADKESGNDIEIDVTASDRTEAESLATKRGVLVSDVAPIQEAPPDEIALVDLDVAPAAPKAKGPPPPPRAGASAAPAAPVSEGNIDPSMKNMPNRGHGTSSGAAGASTAGANVAGASAAGEAANSAGVGGLPQEPLGVSESGDAHGSISGAVGASTSQPGAHMEYHIIMNQSLYLLEVAVNKHLRDGWEPAGGLSVGISNNAMQFFQAMIRHKD
jgi:hypothetical protein